MAVRGTQRLLAFALAVACAVGGWPAQATAAQPAVDTGASVPGETPDAVSAFAAARESGSPVEITGERTETSRVFANPSGTRTLEQYVRPVRARTADGWAPIDTTLVRDPDGTVRPRVAVAGLRLSGGGTGELASISRDDKRLGLSWPAPLPAPVLDGDTATYPEVLPGVDLRVRVAADGFAQLLVVKDATAAANPALREITYRTSTSGLTIRAHQDGTTTAEDNGTPVFVSGTPIMWDSAPAPTARVAASTVDSAEPPLGNERTMGLRVAGDRLTVLPDQAMLTGPDTHFPLYIDPSYSSTQYRWTQVNAYAASTSYWTTQRSEARVGYQNYDGTSRYRSFFQVNAAPFAGSRITRTWFAATLDHSGSCGVTPVDLWHTKAIDPASPVTWNNTEPGHWLSKLDTRSGRANETGDCSGGAQPDLPMEFSSAALQTVVQNAATAKASSLTFGLRAPNESDPLQWKKFLPATARLVVEYNIAPRAPIGLATVPPTPCGTATAPTALNTATPTFSAIASDPDNDNVTGQLEILSGETVISTVTGPTIRSGGAFTWPTVPAGVLPEDQPGAVFSYRARIRDAGLSSPDSARCYFTVDRVRPGTPAITTTDFPDGVPVRSVGELGTVTFTRASADTDVAGFRYGFQQDKTTMWVAAGANGSATVPITLWPRAAGIDRPLYVRAVDRAGNISVATPAWTLTAHDRTVPGTAVRGDTNGDRRADFTTLFDQGDGRTAAWNILAAGNGFSAGYIGWDTDVSGGFPMYRIKSVNGDFDGDGRTDIATFREDPDGMVRLYLLRSDGNRFDAESEPTWSGSQYRLSHLRLAAGDFDGDGDDDVAVFQGLAGNQTVLWVHHANAGRLAAPVQRWDSGAGGLDVGQLAPVAGDFTGDGRDDIAAFRGATGGTRTTLWLHQATATGFAAPAQQWDSGTTTFDRARASYLSTNVDGDAAGRDEIVAVYDKGNAATQLTVFTAGSGTWTTAVGWDSGAANSFDAKRAVAAAGDFNGDGKGDVAALYDIGGGTRQLHTFSSTGTALSNARIDWQGTVADAAASVYIEPNRKYRLLPKHSGKCVEIPAGNTADATPLKQAECDSSASNQQFTLERIGSTPYFKAKVVATGKCLDITGWKHEDNTPVAQSTCDADGGPQANQQFRLDYVEGSGMDVVVQPRIVHSDKCVTVSGASTQAGAAVVQSTCTSAANQRYTLRIEP